MFSVYERLVTGFLKSGIELDPTAFDTLFHVKHSAHIPKKDLASLISSLGFAPLIAENRFNCDLCFTVVPLSKGRLFDLTPVAVSTDAAETILEAYGRKKKILEDAAPVEIMGRRIFSSLKEAKRNLSLECDSPDGLLVDMLGELKVPGKVLDLGCGIGSNALPFLKKGWQLIGVDREIDALRRLEERALLIDTHIKDRLSLIQAPCETLEFPEGAHDVILAVDLLPYIDPTRLKQVLAQIHKTLKVGGLFFGTIFVNSDLKEKAPFIEFMKNLGDNFLAHEGHLDILLRATGFSPLQVKFRLDIDDFIKSTTLQFVATKTAV